MKEEEILKNLKIDALTPMQEAMSEAWARASDVVLLAPTGTGKTLAYLLPLVRSLGDPLEGEEGGMSSPSSIDHRPSSIDHCPLSIDHCPLSTLILTPSRELALQTEQVMKAMGTPWRVVSVYGGRPAMDEHRVLRSIRPHVIVGTPGRINDHLSKGNIRGETVSTLIIDEFDKCLELGFRDEMAQVIGRLPNLRRRVLLSATDADEIPRFVGMGATPGPIRLDFLDPAAHLGRLRVEVVRSPEKDKLQTLLTLLCELGDASTLVFVGYRESADRVAGYLLAHDLPCDVFHGGLEQMERERALYKFAGGSLPVLVCTDLASRGLDLPGVDNVVHYHLPANRDAFTHRNGRTARWEATGTAYLLLHPEEQLPPYLAPDTPIHPLPTHPARPPQPRWATLYIGRGKRDKLSRADVCGFLYKNGQLQPGDLGRIDVKDRYAFVAVRRQKLAQLLTLVRGEKIKGMRTLIEEAR